MKLFSKIIVVSHLAAIFFIISQINAAQASTEQIEAQIVTEQIVTEQIAAAQDKLSHSDNDAAAFSAQINKLYHAIDVLDDKAFAAAHETSKEQDKPGIIKQIVCAPKTFILWIIYLCEKIFKGTYLWIIAPIILIAIIALYVVVSYVSSGANNIFGCVDGYINSILSLLGGPSQNIASFVRNSFNKIDSWPKAAVAIAAVLGISGTAIFAPWVTVFTSITSWVMVGGGVWAGIEMVRRRR